MIIIARMIAWILAITVVILSVVPRELRPHTGVPHNLEHFFAYSITGFAFGLGYERSRRVLAPILVFFCGSVELIQILVPGRHARLIDFIIDALAVLMGLLAASVADRMRAQT